MYKVIPAIMGIDPFKLKNDLEVLGHLNVECLHADVLDGVFTPYISMGQSYFETIAKQTDIPVEIHLQVYDPIKQLNVLNIQEFHRIIVHIEKVKPQDIERLFESISSIKLGVAINPGTNMDIVFNYLKIPFLDKLVLMASDPGCSILSDCIFDRINYMDKHLKQKNIRNNIALQVDGGVKLSNINLFKEAGADEFVCASAIFKGEHDITTNYNKLKEKLSFSELV